MTGSFRNTVVRCTVMLLVWLSPYCQLLAEARQDSVLGKMDVYLCIGQSNMAGRAEIVPQVCDTLYGVYLLDDKEKWEKAVNPLNRYSTIRKDLSMQRLGPAYGFARELVRRTGHTVGLIVNARGGSSINSWLKGSKDGYYEKTLIRVRQALCQGGRLKAVIWHQGEADCASPKAYRVKLKKLIDDLRADLNMPCLPVVVGEISRWNWTKRPEGTIPFNKMIRHVSTFIPYSACVSSRGLKPYKDKTDPHFDTRSQLLLGKRYASAVLKLIMKQAGK